MSVFVDMDPILLGGVIFARDLQFLTSVSYHYVVHADIYHTCDLFTRFSSGKQAGTPT